MVETTLITATRLREILHYDPESGELRWLISPRYWVNIGALAGVLNSRGYRVIKIGGRMYVAHRLAFLWMEGRWPMRKSTTPMVTKPTTGGATFARQRSRKTRQTRAPPYAIPLGIRGSPWIGPSPGKRSGGRRLRLMVGQFPSAISTHQSGRLLPTYLRLGIISATLRG